VKLGAVDYMSKPADADDVAAALLALDGHKAEPPANPMSADRVRREHIQRIYELCGRNVSGTARRLNMHRRTLPRIRANLAPKQRLARARYLTSHPSARPSGQIDETDWMKPNHRGRVPRKRFGRILGLRSRKPGGFAVLTWRSRISRPQSGLRP